MNYMTDGVRFEARMGDGSASGVLGKLWGAGKRMFTGESLFLTHFTNESKAKARVAFAAPYPGTVTPIDLAAVDGKLFCQKDAYLCADFGQRIDLSLRHRIGAGLLGGEGFIITRREDRTRVVAGQSVSVRLTF